jgi:imidazolonepropionase-like amidohydrolase
VTPSKKPPVRLVFVLLVFTAVAVASCVTTHFTLPLVDPIHRLPGPTVFRDVSVFDGESPIVHVHQDVVVEAGVITRMSSTGRPIPANATVVDGRGKTLMPALVDMHTHVTSTASPPWAISMPDRAHNLEAHLFAGVATITDLAGDLETLRETQTLVDDHALPGPRVYVSGPQVSVPGGYPGAMIRRLYPFPIGTLVVALGESGVRSPDEARALVRARIKRGADLIKVAIADTPGDTPVITDALLAAVVDEAHLGARKVVAHIDSREHALFAARHGVDALAHIVHMGELTDDDAAEIARAGTAVIPTLVVFDRLEQFRAGDLRFTTLEQVSEPTELLLAFAPEAIANYTLESDLSRWLDELMRHSAARRANVAALHRAGAVILVGTDANGAPGVFPGAIHEEMQRLVEAGVPTIDVLRGATSRAARFVAGSDAPFGVVEAGARADLLLVEGNPLFDITRTSRIVMVMQDGRAIVRIGAP